MDYRDNFYKKYVSTHTDNLYGKLALKSVQREFPILSAYFQHFLPKNKDIKILDLACGNGGFLYWLEQIGYKNAYGVDLSHEQIEFAKKIGLKNIYEDNAISFLKSKKEEYDIIFARDFFEHLNKNELLIAGNLILESLKKDGVFILQTVNAETLFGARLRYGDITHEMAFTRTSIEQFLSQAGFTDIKIYPMRPVIHSVFSFIRYFIWRLVEIFLYIVLVSGTGYKKGIFTQDILCSAKK